MNSTSLFHHSISRLPRGKLVAVLVFILYAWFFNGSNANQIARLDVVFSFVEPNTSDTNTFHIDQFKGKNQAHYTNTCDWANNPLHDSHFYSNKAPLPSILAIPIYTVLFHAETFWGINPKLENVTTFNSYILNLFVTVLPVSISAYFFFLTLLIITKNDHFLSSIGTIALYFGTLVFPFSTQMWGHTTALSFIVIATYYLLQNSPSKSNIAYTGFFLGLAVLSDYTSAIAVFTSIGMFLARKESHKIIEVVKGATLPMVLYGIYHTYCFGNPIIPAPVYSNEIFVSSNAAGGLFESNSTITALWALSFSPYRGLFWFMPFLILFTKIFLVNNRSTAFTWLTYLALSNIILHFLMISLFNGWHGGWTTGPRYLIVSLHWYVLVIIRSFSQTTFKTNRLVTTLSAALLALSLSNMFVIAVVSPTAPNIPMDATPAEKKIWQNPMFHLYEKFWMEEYHILAPNFFPIRTHGLVYDNSKWNAFNVGKLLGLSTRWQAFLPIIIFMIGITVIFIPRKKLKIHKQS